VIIQTTAKTEYLRFQNLAEYPEIKHFVSTRKGGVSQNRFKGLNISFETDENPKNVLKNRQILAEAVEIPLETFVMQNQIHGNTVVKVTGAERGRGIDSHKTVIGNSDAMICNEPGICLFLFAGDCVPILFFDPKQKVIGAAHSGWGGTVKKVAQKTVRAMQENFGCRAEDILAGIGPSIGVKNYEVGDNVTQAVEKAFGTTENYMIQNSKTGKMHFDLWQTNKMMLTEIGLKSENIEISGLCTFDNPNLFFSARCDDPTGRFGAGIFLK
jgi:hypothetical protein